MGHFSFESPRGEYATDMPRSRTGSLAAAAVEWLLRTGFFADGCSMFTPDSAARLFIADRSGCSANCALKVALDACAGNLTRKFDSKTCKRLK